MPQMTDTELKAILQAEKLDALSSYNNSELTTQRAQALNYFLGDVSADMPALEGRSSVVSTDVADTVNGLLPILMEIFEGTDEVVRFNPVGEEDVEAAQQETDAVNYVYNQQNNGYLTSYEAIQDALVSKTGIVKVWWETKQGAQRETYYDQPEDAYNFISANPDLEIVAHTDKGNGLHDFTIQVKKDESKCCVAAVPPEEFGISRHATLSTQDAPYLYHEPANGLSQRELIEQGFDPAQIATLPSYADPQQNKSAEQTARDTVLEHTIQQGDEGYNKPNRRIRITEHYIWLDYEGDNKPRRYRVTTGGEDSVVLRRKTDEGDKFKPDIEEIDWWPFAVGTPFIQPHRFFGRSVADVTMDLQRINTALNRGLLDNIYFAMHPRPEVAETTSTPDTLDDVMNWRPGAPIRVKQPGTVIWQQVPDMTGTVLPALQYFDAKREWRTGVSRQGQGLDPNTLQNQTATAVTQVMNAAQARSKLIARNLAETLFTDLFWLMHSTLRKYGSVEMTMRLRNKWVTVNPREWKERNDMTINVGLGRGSRAEESALIQSIIGMQAQAAQFHVLNIEPKQFFNSASRFCQINGIKNVEDYFPDPGDAPMPAPPPDPEITKMQAQAQIEQTQAQADIATQQQKAQTEAGLQQQKFELERQLAILEHELKVKEAHVGMVAKAMSVTGPDGHPTISANDLLERLAPKPKKTRLRKVGPGEYISEHISEDGSPASRTRLTKVGPGDYISEPQS